MDGIMKANRIAKCLDDKKGRDIAILNISDITTIGDYFVIASASSAPQIKAMADEVLEKMHEQGYDPIHIEGYSTATWILLDYGDVIVHVFHDETRSFYGIERLWTDAVKVEYISQEKL